MKKTIPILLALLAFALPSVAQDKNKWDISKLDASKLPPAAAKTPVTFAQDIKPLFETSCVNCHGEEKQKGGLRLDSLDAVLKGGKAGKMVVPGESAKSVLVLSISQQDPGTAMPPKRRAGPGRPPGAATPPGGASRGPGGPGDKVPNNRPEGSPGRVGPLGKPLTSEQVALVRAWIDQGAK